MTMIPPPTLNYMPPPERPKRSPWYAIAVVVSVITGILAAITVADSRDGFFCVAPAAGVVGAVLAVFISDRRRMIVVFIFNIVAILALVFIAFVNVNIGAVLVSLVVMVVVMGLPSVVTARIMIWLTRAEQ